MQMDYVRAYAKLNLTLDVLHKRSDGYHDLRSVMHTVDLYNIIGFEAAADIRVEADFPLPQNSAAYRAAREYQKRTGSGGANITIEGHIPSEAGLGSSSADAAAVLRAMQKHYGMLSETELFSIARGIGADVPFCLMGGCALAEGIGDVLTPLPNVPLALLLVKGEGGISTRALFESLKLPLNNGNSDAAVVAIRKGDRDELMKHIHNSLIDAAADALPVISANINKMASCGALASSMTGSGSAVFGIFADKASAQNAAAELKNASFVHVCGTLDRDDIIFYAT